VKLTPETGTLFATLKLGEECSFAENLKVIGVKDCNEEFTVEKIVHLIQPVLLLQALVINEGLTPATLDGSANVLLNSTGHSGKSWSGKPA